MEKEIKLNIGSGRDIKESTDTIKWYNVDRHLENGANLKHELPKPLPFKDNTIDEIYCSHVLEDFGDEYLPIMRDFHRVLKLDGILHIKVPIGLSVQNPYHKRFFDETSFHCFVINRSTSYEFSEIPHFCKMLKLKVNRINPLRSIIFKFERGPGREVKEVKTFEKKNSNWKEKIIKLSDKLLPLKKFEVEVILRK